MQALLTTLSPRAAMKDYVIQPNEIFVLVLEGKVRTEFADGRELVPRGGRQRRLHIRGAAGTGTRTFPTGRRGSSS